MRRLADPMMWLYRAQCHHAHSPILNYMHVDVQGWIAHRSTPAEGFAASASGPNTARNMAKFAPVATVGEMRYATDTFLLRGGVAA